MSLTERKRSVKASVRPSLLGDSLAVELPALTRSALVRIQVPQPILSHKIYSYVSIGLLCQCFMLFRYYLFFTVMFWNRCKYHLKN